MPTEIERKFLVKGDEWRQLGTGTLYRQGYIPTENGTTVRVRLVGESGYLTIKGLSVGIARAEFEYAIPVADAQQMLDTLCEPPLIEKTRYRLDIEGILWEVDEFAGDNQGLIVAEVELTEETQHLVLPSWIEREVSDDPRYYNVNLAQNPYSNWVER